VICQRDLELLHRGATQRFEAGDGGQRHGPVPRVGPGSGFREPQRP
jgi:hypothetical protein